ncbi:MAG: TlpA family protein disulfide reductase [Leucobacter sp.]
MTEPRTQKAHSQAPRTRSRANDGSRAHSSRIRRALVLAAVPLAAALALSACSSGGDSLAAQWNEGGDKGYVEGDGSTLSIAPSERTDPVDFSGQTDFGGELDSSDTIGNVTVVNFWYAGCAPCRAEAGDLVESYDEYSPEGVEFVGVNTRDEVSQAKQFADEFGIEYPSIMDNAEGRAVQRSFAGEVPLNAVPTTLVLDSEGRIAHRVLGQLADASQLNTLIQETLDEDAAADGSAE